MIPGPLDHTIDTKVKPAQLSLLPATLPEQIHTRRLQNGFWVTKLLFFFLEATAEKRTGKLFIVAKFQKGKTDLFCDFNYFRVIIIVKCQHPLPELLLSVHNGFCF